jgi:hypothetical protein
VKKATEGGSDTAGNTQAGKEVTSGTNNGSANVRPEVNENEGPCGLPSKCSIL